MERTAQPPAGTCLWSSASGRPVQSVTSEVKPCSWVCFACVKRQKAGRKCWLPRAPSQVSLRCRSLHSAQAVTLLLYNAQSASAADRICSLRQNPATVLCPLSLQHPLVNPPSDHWWALCWVVGTGRPGQARVHADSRVGSPADKPLPWQVTRPPCASVSWLSGGGWRSEGRIPNVSFLCFRPTQPQDLLPSEWGGGAEQQHQPDGV